MQLSQANVIKASSIVKLRGELYSPLNTHSPARVHVIRSCQEAAHVKRPGCIKIIVHSALYFIVFNLF